MSEIAWNLGRLTEVLLKENSGSFVILQMVAIPDIKIDCKHHVKMRGFFMPGVANQISEIKQNRALWEFDWIKPNQSTGLCLIRFTNQTQLTDDSECMVHGR